MPTYVLSKVKRTGAGQKVSDLVDVDANTVAPGTLTELATDDEIVVLDKSAKRQVKTIARSAFMTWLNALVAPTWAKISGKPSTFAPSSHTHTSGQISGLGSAAVKDVGTGSGNVPELDSSGHLDNARLSGIPRTALSTSSGTVASTPRGGTVQSIQDFSTPAYSFRPTVYWERDPSDNVTAEFFKPDYFNTGGHITNDSEHKWSLRTSGSSNTRSGVGTAHWIYLSTSHRPSAWVRQARVLDDQGMETDVLIPDAWNVWIAEDPLVDGDTKSPLGDGGIKIGLPSDAIISALIATRSAARDSWYIELVGRGWLTITPASYSDAIAAVSDRYKPAARLWAMRAIAEADGIGEAAAYLTLLRVGAGNTWELRG